MITTAYDILSEELDLLQADIISRHENAGQVASGKTRSSFERNMVSDYRGQLLGASYSGVLQKGRKPGKLPFDFKDILLRWAAAKRITFNTPSQARTWAFFVTKKIREEGTRLFRTNSEIDIFNTAVDNFSNRLSERIGTFFQEELANTIFIN